MPRTPFGKSRPVEKPYAIYKHGDWEFRVLKTYKHPEKEDMYSRWLVAAKSPNTFGSWEYGDTYCQDIKNLPLVLADEGWLEYYGKKGV